MDSIVCSYQAGIQFIRTSLYYIRSTFYLFCLTSLPKTVHLCANKIT